MNLELIGGILMALVGLSAAGMAKWTWQTEWRWLGCGALLWFAAVFEKWTLDAWLHQPVLGGLENNCSRPAFLAFGSAYIGLLTGVTEVAITLVAGLIWRRLAANARRSIGIGVGAGAMEAIFFGLQSTGAALSHHEISTAQPIFSMTAIFAPAVERAIVIIIHASVSAMILFAVATRKWLWFWAAFSFFSLIDGLSGFYILTKMYDGNIWLIEFSYAAFAIISIPILQYLCRHWPIAPKQESS